MPDYSPNPNLHFIINDMMIAHMLDELRAVGAKDEQLAALKVMLEQEMLAQKQRKRRNDPSDYRNQTDAMEELEDQ